MTLAENLPITTAEWQKRMLLDFLKQTGYGPSDLLSLNYQTREFYTRNGGKYFMDEDGKVNHVTGPSEDPSERM